MGGVTMVWTPVTTASYKSPKQKEAADLTELAKLQKKLGLSKAVGK